MESLTTTQSLDSMASNQASDFLSPFDDTYHHDSPSAASLDGSVAQDGVPDPVIIHSKPAKKRKSWGQELPEPKTSLPPRKRAKTDDEKEQRRIERIKRNRAAAHNSRERKRQETETLAVALARANAELDAYRKLHGPLPASVVLPEVTVCNDEADTPAASHVDSRASMDAFPSPATTTDDFLENNVTIKQENQEPQYPTAFQQTFDALDSKANTSLPPFDLTQHSAAMLCDLQCRSNSWERSQATWWAALFLSLMTSNLLHTSKTLLMAIWAQSPSRMARLMQASAHRLTSRSTSSSTTLRLSQSTQALAQRNAATASVQRLLQGQLWATYRQQQAWASRQSQQHHQSGMDMTALEEPKRDGEFDRDRDGGVE